MSVARSHRQMLPNVTRGSNHPQAPKRERGFGAFLSAFHWLLAVDAPFYATPIAPATAPFRLERHVPPVPA